MVDRSKHKKSAPSADWKRILTFLGAAFRDYIAARVLFNNALPLQGAIQASTAIEKYFKTFLAFRGNISHGHLKQAHFNAVRNLAPDLYNTFNEEFLYLCQRVYELRYPDALPNGYNVVIAAREFLAELDDVALVMHGAFCMWQGDEELKSDVDQAISKKDPRLLFNNHVLFQVDKQHFIREKPQFVYEMRINPEQGGMVEITYVARPRESDGHFLREGARPSGPESFLLAFKILPDEEIDDWSPSWIIKDVDNDSESTTEATKKAPVD